MKCEKCNKEHDGSYGSGRFCCDKCARSFSSKMVNEKEVKDAICYKCGKEHTIKKRASEKNTLCVECRSGDDRWMGICIYCGGKLKTETNLFCSSTCKGLYNNLIYKPDTKNHNQYRTDKIIEYSKDVKSIAGLLKKLDLNVAGGNYATIKKWLQILNVDTSHWTGQGWNKGEQLKDWSSYSRSSTIKPHLIKKNGHRCESCGGEKWLDGDIPLEIHHKDFNRTNNDIDNLQLLCPNCHSFTDNYRGKGKNIK